MYTAACHHFIAKTALDGKITTTNCWSSIQMTKPRNQVVRKLNLVVRYLEHWLTLSNIENSPNLWVQCWVECICRLDMVCRCGVGS